MPSSPAFADNVLVRARSIKAISFDVDGVLTDGRITYSDSGAELKSFHVQDGAALKLLQQQGIPVAIITGRNSPMVARRCSELGIEYVYQGNEQKEAAARDFAKRCSVALNEVGHVGDDLADLALFDLLGFAISVPNGHPVVMARADYVTAEIGGNGVAREVAQLLLTAKALWPY